VRTSSRLVLCAAAIAAAPVARADAQLPPLPVPVPTQPPVATIVPVPVHTGPAPDAYQANDGGGFRDILPSGTRGRYDGAELAALEATGATVPHCCDQLAMYANLKYATPGLTAADLSKYFKDSSFGVAPGNVESTESPRDDVTIVRDKGFGVPHIYGRNRAGAMFGMGYAGAEDRLFFMDVLRHAGRGEVASFAGGANASMDRDQWAVAPYTEADLQKQAADLPKYLGAQGTQIVADVNNYIAGINQYIDEAKLDPTKMPGEYAAIGRPQGPDLFTPADLIATAALVGGIFGKGGGEELQFSRIADALQKRFGTKLGMKVFRNFRSSEDPEAPVTVFKKRFPYQVRAKQVAKGSVARPDRGSFTPLATVASAATYDGFPARASNALLVSAKESLSGHALMVAGPQVAYFNPQILMEEDVHAPASADGPGIDAQGAAFNGINLYVQLGRGRDYAWSATSAGQDIIDTFALPLCDDTHYRYRGACLPIEVLQKTDAWTPNPGDPTPAGSQTLTAERTKLGLVAGRGKVHGKPVLFTTLRSTYFHEVDSAAGFMDFNTPSVVHDARSFQRAASKIGYTFNWFYADPKHIAYFNSGANPVRAKHLDYDFPVAAKYAWQGWNPDTWQARFTPFSAHPQAIDQRYLVNWNNKQARGFASADANAYSSTYRSVMLEDQLKKRIAGSKKITLPQLVDAMEVGGSQDLRAKVDLPLALKVIGRPKDPAVKAAVAKLKAWLAAGGLRKDANRDGAYEHSDAIRLLDAWWPRWVRAEFEPQLGNTAYDALTSTIPIDDSPNGGGQHHGSSYQGSWFGYVSKDLRTTLRRKVRGRYAKRFCGSLKHCRRVLSQSLAKAATIPANLVYGGDATCQAGNQICWDAIRQRPTGGATQPLIEWINRPTFQQAVEVQHTVPR
jgi:acyl-homoserine lactone acylase PvdQ